MSTFRRVLGIILALTAVVGMLLALFGILQTWSMKPTVSSAIRENLTLIDTTANTTLDLLSVSNDALTHASVSVSQIQTATQTIAASLDQSKPILTSLDTLLTQEIPNTITTTRTSLISAQGSAQLIDNILSGLSSIPFIGGSIQQYKPAVPLHTALGNVASSLTDLPPRLSSMHSDISNAQSNLATIELEVVQIGSEVGQVKTNIYQAQAAIGQYQDTMLKIKSRVTYAQDHLDGWMNTTAALLTIVLVWIAFTQVGLLVQALDMLQLRKE